MKSTHLLILQSCLLVAQPSFSQKGKQSQSFSTPGTYKFIVPKATTLLTVTLKGSGGWGGWRCQRVDGDRLFRVTAAWMLPIMQGGTAGIAGRSGSGGTNGIALKGGTNNARAAGKEWGGAEWFGGGSSVTYNSTFLSDDPYASGGGGGGSNYVKGLTGNIVNNATGSIGGVGNNLGIYGSVNISWK